MICMYVEYVIECIESFKQSPLPSEHLGLFWRGKKNQVFFPATTEQNITRVTLALRGLEEPFFISSCAVVSVFCSGRKYVAVLHTTYVLRSIVPWSCGVVLVFLVLAGNSFWCFVRMQIDLIHFEHTKCISSTSIKTNTNPLHLKVNTYNFV